MSFGTRVRFEFLRSASAATIAAASPGFVPLEDVNGNAPFLHQVRQLIVQNFTDVLINFSDDGTNVKFVLPSGGQAIFDFTSNEVKDDGLFLALGTIIYAAENGAPTTGSVYCTPIYALGD